MVLMLFQARKTPTMCFAHPYALHDIIAAKMMHLVVGHTLRYTVSNFGVNRTYGSQDTAIFVSPLS